MRKQKAPGENTPSDQIRKSLKDMMNELVTGALLKKINAVAKTNQETAEKILGIMEENQGLLNILTDIDNSTKGLKGKIDGMREETESLTQALTKKQEDFETFVKTNKIKWIITFSVQGVILAVSLVLLVIQFFFK
jgi:uncharacterized coiled-coil DUF342 family protein